MTACVRIEWATLGVGGSPNGPAHALKGLHGAAVTLEVTGTPTGAAARPAAPAFGIHGVGYALVRCLGTSDRSVVVAWGEDPTAAAANGRLIEPGEEVPILCREDTLFSFVEVAG